MGALEDGGGRRARAEGGRQEDFRDDPGRIVVLLRTEWTERHPFGTVVRNDRDERKEGQRSENRRAGRQQRFITAERHATRLRIVPFWLVLFVVAVALVFFDRGSEGYGEGARNAAVHGREVAERQENGDEPSCLHDCQFNSIYGCCPV